MKTSKPTKKQQSTFQPEMNDLKFKEAFEAEYQEFALSEALLQLMDEEGMSVRKLAKVAGISPTVIQDIRSGNRSNITVQNLCKIFGALGSSVAVRIGDRYVPLNPHLPGCSTQ